MKKVISLNGKWDLRGIGPNGEQKTLTAAVPGHVLNDLLVAGEVPDIFWRDNAEKCQWVEDWTWIYSREFEIPEDFPLDFCEMRFEGLDVYSEITLNGELLGETDNMLVPHRFFDMNAYLKPGKNKIEVKFFPYKKKIEGKSLDYPAAFNISDRVHVRRMQCTFYWDWVNRFISAGIWRSVSIISYDNAYIEDVFVYTKSIDKTSVSLTVELETDKNTDDVIKATIDIFDPYGKKVWSEKLRVWHWYISLQADLKNAMLWWPHGYGDQPLYKCVVRLYNNSGALIDEKAVDFGIRTVRLEMLKDEPGSKEAEMTKKVRAFSSNDQNGDDEPGMSFTLLVNGERIYCKGGNWVPADPLPERVSAEKYDRLIKMARDANINLLRCWGGGIYEPEEFWKACDKYGVMVSQDFIMACAKYPEDDEEFLMKLDYEIPIAIKALRGHPSLVWWCGDNENSMGFDWDDPNGWGKKIANEILAPLCAQLDPSRPFRPTSPYGGHNNSSPTIGDVHYSGWDDTNFVTTEDMRWYKERQKIVGRFMSESGNVGGVLTHSLLKFMSKEDLEDPSRAMFEYHTKNNPHQPEGYPTLYRMQEIYAEKLFGAFKNTFDRINKQTYLQYEWVRVAHEAARRSKWYNSGVQYWMYNDCWPATGWSQVDYYLIPKGGFYAMKRTAKPVIASIDNTGSTYQVYICNDRLIEAKGSLELFVQSFNGWKWPVKAIDFTVAANESAPVLEVAKSGITMGKDCILVCDISGNFEPDRAFYYDGIPYEMEFAPVELKIEKSGDGKTGTVTVSADGYARVVTFEGDVYMSDNFFDLLPGESKTVKYECLEGTIDDVKIYCWNSKNCPYEF